MLKRAYDIAGTVLTILCTNYISAPFMLLTIRDSLQVWRLLEWYGFWFIFGGLAFFYAGGERVLKTLHPKQMADAETKNQHSTFQTTIPNGLALGTGPETPGFIHPVDSAAKEVKRKLE
jgi:hypothetical protein